MSISAQSPRLLDKLGIAAAFGTGILTARPFLAGWDQTFVTASHSIAQGFDRTPGCLDVSDYWLRALVPEPISSGNSLFMQPAFDYRATVFRFIDVPTSLPVDPERLESFGVYPSVVEISTLAWFETPDSPWMFGAWTAAGLATDFRDLNHEDLTFDLAAGAAYRCHDSLSVGVGAAATDLSGESALMPGIGLDWRINEQTRLAICGPFLSAAYSPHSDWQIDLRGESTSQIWSITDGDGKSRHLDFSSYRLGLFTSHRLFEGIHLSAGAGVTFGNKIGLNRTNGDEIIAQHLDSGVFCQVGLRITMW